MISLPEEKTLLPQQRVMDAGNGLYVLPSSTTDLVRLDVITEAGSAYQKQFLTAAAASRLHTVASEHHTAAEVAEWLDYRGIIVENTPNLLGCSTTVYALRKYCDELLPMLAELRCEAAFPQSEFDLYCAHRKQEMLAAAQRSRDVARRLYYQALFGNSHPLGMHASPEDADRLELANVKAFYQRHYLDCGGPTVVLSGNVNAHLENLVAKYYGTFHGKDIPRKDFKGAGLALPAERCSETISGSVQTSLRIGRVLPLTWNSMDYARFMILTTALGGYFGSRLMTNLREDKGYTYGIYSRTQIYRGAIVFFITTDVAQGTAEAAEQEVRNELRRLCDTPMSDEELGLVKTVLAGDFIRSVDGIFERAERLCQMLQNEVDEQFTSNLRRALKETTAAQLQELAQRLLDDRQMVFCRAGV